MSFRYFVLVSGVGIDGGDHVFIGSEMTDKSATVKREISAYNVICKILLLFVVVQSFVDGFNQGIFQVSAVFD